MTWSAREIFDKQEIVEARKVVGEYEFCLDDLPTKITIRISREFNPPIPEEPFHFEQSHYMHTPKQLGPYMTSRPWSSTEEGALHRAVDGLLSYYKEAVKAGHAAETSWLVPNNQF